MILVKFKWDCDRSGKVEGLFVTTQKELDNAIGKEIYFGEILGKHSEVFGTLDKGNLEILFVPEETIAKLIVATTSSTIVGYNPLDYFEGEEDEC